MQVFVRKLKDFIIEVETLIAKMVLKFHKVTFGDGIRIKGQPFVINRGTFRIGRNVRVNSRMSANPIGGNQRCYFVVGKSAELTIGDGVALSNVSVSCYNRITIENNVMLGGSAKIYDTDFHSTNPELRRLDAPGSIVTKPILIKEGAFVGGHSIILKGVTVGRNSIIGAGSVVTRNIPDNEIWAGNPATFIKKVGSGQ